jgi:hypothetical protein
MVVSVSLVKKLRKQPGKRIANSTATPGSARSQRDGTLSGVACAVAWRDPTWDIGGHTYAENGRTPATIFFLSLPSCFPGFAERSGEAKNGPKGRSKRRISLRKFGAGEGIRTLDPNLGKVVLYP